MNLKPKKCNTPEISTLVCLAQAAHRLQNACPPNTSADLIQVALQSNYYVA